MRGYKEDHMSTTVTTPRIDEDFSYTPLGASHSSRIKERVVLPLPPALADLEAGQDTRFEMEIYARFMRHLRNVPNSRMEIKILSAIQFTADILEIADALVAKTLVDLGLKAPRKAFPVSFLDFCDKALLRRNWDQYEIQGGPPHAVLILREHWDGIGEEKPSPFPAHYAVLNERVTMN